METKAYKETIDFSAGRNTPEAVVAFKPSETAQARVSDLLARERSEGLSVEEKSELDHCEQLEHSMRLAKARARQFLRLIKRVGLESCAVWRRRLPSAFADKDKERNKKAQQAAPLQ